MTFEIIYEEYWQKIYRLCLAYVNDTERAQDLAQETFITVWEKLDTFRNEASIGTWIYRIASNNCLREIKTEKRLPKTELNFEVKEETEESIEPQIRLLYQFISELPELERIIISLELEEIQQAEIAEIVGLSAGNVRVRIHRIKEKLTQKFRSNG